MRYLILILILLARTASAVTGDIFAASTTNLAGQAFQDSANNLCLWIHGMGTNGAYQTGFSITNWTSGAAPIAATNLPVNAKNALAVVTVTSQGFDTSGHPTTYQRTLYATTPLRYPLSTFNDEQLSGSDVKITLWLSQPIYVGDSNITVTVKSGLYVQGGVTNNTVSGLTVTNASTASYPNIVGNWVWPDREVESASTWTNYCIGFQAYAMNGQPLAYVQDVATDAHGHSETKVATLVKDSSRTIGNPFFAYETTHTTATFTEGDTVSNIFVMYPWIGTSNQILYSTNTTLTGLIPNQFHPRYIVADPNGTFGGVAVISPTGNDSTGVATNAANLAAAVANPFLTIPYAVQGLRLYHASHATPTHNNASGGVIYCQAQTNGLYPAYIGNSYAADTAFCTVMPYPGVTQSQVVFTNYGGLHDSPDCDFLKFKNVTLLENNNYAMFYSSASSKWFALNNCYFQGYVGNNAADWTWGNGGCLGITSCLISNNNNHQNIWGVWVVGNRTDGINPWFGRYTAAFVANSETESSANTLDHLRLDDGNGHGTDDALVYNNSVYKNSEAYVTCGTSIQWGLALVQNTIEEVTDGNQPSLSIGPPNTPCTNVLLMKNTLPFNRPNIFYYGTGGSPIWHTGIAMQDNSFETLATKSDEFLGDGTQYGNWSFRNGSLASGNYLGNWAGASVNEGMEFIGFTGIFPNASDVSQFVNDQSSGGSAGGLGDYHLQSKSPALNILSSWNGIPWDIEGNNRGDIDPPGAYSTANPRRGGLMICN